MIIRNDTHEPLVVALRNHPILDDREELLEPGEESEWLHLEDGDNNSEGADIITIEPSPKPYFVSEVKVNGN